MSDVWLTPAEIMKPLGRFDLDPCAWDQDPTRCASQGYTRADNGLLMPWFGRVWVNPPYSKPKPWMARIAGHGVGTLMMFAATDTQAFKAFVFDAASAILFIQQRVSFLNEKGLPGTSAPKPSVLVAYGQADAEVLADSGIDGFFMPLTLPRIYLVAAISETWRDVLLRWVREQEGPVSLSAMYEAMRRHPKSRNNPTFDATIRRVLQEGPFERVERGMWRAA